MIQSESKLSEMLLVGVSEMLLSASQAPVTVTVTVTVTIHDSRRVTGSLSDHSDAAALAISIYQRTMAPSRTLI
jgi:hypothetical protein